MHWKSDHQMAKRQRSHHRRSISIFLSAFLKNQIVNLPKAVKKSRPTSKLKFFIKITKVKAHPNPNMIYLFFQVITGLFKFCIMINTLTTSAGEIDFQNQTHRKIALQFQLKMLQLYGPTLGMYVLPNLQDEDIWNGIIFVRSGFYKGGKFKFTLNMKDFPLKQPNVCFNSKLNHPLVNEVTGELDVSSTLSDIWNYYQENMLYNLMKDMKKMFTDKSRLSNKFSGNRNIAELFDRNLHEFIIKAMQSVSDSIDKLHENDETWVLKITEPSNQTDSIKRILSEVVDQKELKIQDKIQMFLKIVNQ